MSTIFNKLKLTQDEEMCIMHFIMKARDCDNNSWNDCIDSIYSKYLQEKYKVMPEAQAWQTV